MDLDDTVFGGGGKKGCKDIEKAAGAVLQGAARYAIIDLHCHLDGAITADIAKHLAALQAIALPVKDDKELLNRLSVTEECKSLNDFLKCFNFPNTLLQSEEGITEAVYLVCENMRKEGLLYLELRFAPQLHCNKTLTQESAILSALMGIRKSRLHANLILCCMRGEDTHNKNMETIALAKKYCVPDGGVVAIDLAGAEALFPTSSYAKEFTLASNSGIPFTIHAGEVPCSIDSLSSALDFGARRIGHGVHAEDDNALVKRIIQNNVTLEMSPTSNRLTKAFPDMALYPLKKYLDMGIKVTLNTDDPAICQTTLKREWEYMQKVYSLTDKQMQAMCLNAVDAAFTTEAVKSALRRQLED